MGLSKSKTKTTSDPWAPAQPYILKGMEQTSQVFDQNQPTLQKMSGLAQDAFNRIAPTAFAPSPYVTDAQKTASNIAGGAYLDNNPGAATYKAIQGGTNPAIQMLTDIAGGDGLKRTIGGQYLNGQPSAGLYASMLDPSYANGNPFLQNVIDSTNADVTKAANQRFAASGMGSGLSSAFGDVLSRNLAKNEGALRYQNYNDASNRQLAAAGQSDAAYNAERGRMMDAQGQQIAAAQGLGSTFNQQQQTQLAAGQAADQSHNAAVAQMLTAAGLAPELASAQYAGVSPALALLNSAADIPYVGTAALNGQIRQASNGYGTQTTTQNQGLGSMLGGLAGAGLAGWASGGFKGI